MPDLPFPPKTEFTFNRFSGYSEPTKETVDAYGKWLPYKVTYAMTRVISYSMMITKIIQIIMETVITIIRINNGGIL